jgi:MFS family permease
MHTASAPTSQQAFSQKAMLWIVFAGFFMQTLDTTIVNTALPSMAHSLGERPLDLKPVVVAYTLTMAMLTPASGWLADKFGTRRVYFCAILIFVLGGWLVQSASWHWIFLINVPVGLFGLFAVRRYLPQGETGAAPPFDWIGCGLLSLCMVTFSLALENGAHSPWSALLAAVSIASALLYIPHARRHRTPLFRLALFREPNFSIGLVGNLVCRIGSGAVPFLLPLLFQLQLGYSPFHSGLMLLPVAIAGTISKRWIVPLVNRFGYDTFLMVNTVIVGASIASFAAMSPGWPLALSILQLATFGAANSMQFAAMNSVTLKGLSREDAGSGNSLFSMVQMLAIGLGVTIGGGLVSLFSAKLGVAAPAFRLAFLSVGVITLLSALVFRRLDADLINPKSVKRAAAQAR